MNDLVKKQIEQMVSRAIEDTFSDSLIYGVGFLKVITNGDDLDIQHIPFAELEGELEKVVEFKKFAVRN